MWPNRFGIMQTWLRTSSGIRSTAFFPLVNNQQWNHGTMLTPAHTRSCFERTFMFIHLLFPLLRDMTKLEVRSLASMCSNILNTSPLLTSRHVYPFTRYRIPVSPWVSQNASGQTKLETVILSGPEVNISSSWRSKSQSRAIAVTRQTIWCTQNSPLLPPCDG